ncbi:MAG: LacI family transcriptional regulator, partial [Lachnospiraceae bacterium]|nr:LacI family transcriptional regulator [Lachnospiraceae bacterium]
YDADLVIWFHTEDRMIHPYERIRQMIGEGKEMEAVVCYNDQIAVQVIKALQDLGRKVPEDVSVTGYDNSYIANSGGMKLTTIAHPQEKLGEMAAQLLIDLIQNKESEVKQKKIEIEPELILGTSCCKRRNSQETKYV